MSTPLDVTGCPALLHVECPALTLEDILMRCRAAGDSALHKCMFYDDDAEQFMSAFSILVDDGYDPNYRDPRSQLTALYWAISKRNVAACMLLMERGADPSLGRHDRYCHWTPLSIAVEYGNQQVVDMLLEAGADINACNGLAIRNAVLCRNVAMIVKLLYAGVTIPDATTPGMDGAYRSTAGVRTEYYFRQCEHQMVIVIARRLHNAKARIIQRAVREWLVRLSAARLIAREVYARYFGNPHISAGRKHLYRMWASEN